MSKSPSIPACVRCIHYFVTWDKTRPHGCRAMRFKSKAIPSVVVKKNSGMECLKYRPKTQKKH